MNKSELIKQLVYECEHKFDAFYIGLHDNSFDDLCYSEYRVKQELRLKWKCVQYIPFVYKNIYLLLHALTV